VTKKKQHSNYSLVHSLWHWPHRSFS